MTHTMQEQCDNVSRVKDEAKLLISDEVQLKHLDLFLETYWSCTKVKPFHVQFIDSRIGVRWDWDDGYVSVLFGPDNDWEWSSESQAVEREEYGVYHRKSWYKGKCSYTIKDRSYYHLPDEVENIITVPDTFVATYEPIIPDYDLKLIWETSRYDGMLAGYVRHKGKLHYADCIDETDFTRERMFAVYELSRWERIKVWMSYFKWHTVLYSPILWAMYMFKHRHTTRKHDPEYKTKFAAKHKLVGYFAR